jgi:uncharacterized membrane protein SpoIIM required for sporulation
MKETSFIAQNKEKWKRFEEIQTSEIENPEVLSELYMDLNDDLSYAQTFYHKRTVRVYLNRLAQLIFTGMHKQKKEPLKAFIHAWRYSVPLEIYRARKIIIFAFLLFTVFSALGVVLTKLNPDFPSQVLSPGYVEQTNENIKNGNPLAIYEQGQESSTPIGMFIRITTNNLKVAFLTFFLGFFFAIGTYLILFYNGVMLGVFQYFFYTKSLLLTSFLGIWIHGAFEISAIVIAGASGIVVGNGWLFPGTYTRLQSMQMAAIRGMKIMLSIIPILIVAGALESFVTANYQVLPDWSKWMLIIFSFALILFFYLFYPIYVARKFPEKVNQNDTAIFTPIKPVILHKIRKFSEIISDGYQHFRKQFGTIIRLNFLFVFPLILIAIGVQTMNHYDMMLREHFYDWYTMVCIMTGRVGENYIDLLMCVYWSFIFTISYAAAIYSFSKGQHPSFLKFLANKGFRLWVGLLLPFVFLFYAPFYLIILTLLILPLTLIIGPTMALSSESFGKSFKLGFKFSKQQFGNNFLIIALAFCMIIILAQPIALVFSIQNLVPDLLDLTVDFCKRIFMTITTDYLVICNVIRQLIYTLFFILMLPLIAICCALVFYSEDETLHLHSLKEQFKVFGKRKKHTENDIDFE